MYTYKSTYKSSELHISSFYSCYCVSKFYNIRYPRKDSMSAGDLF